MAISIARHHFTLEEYERMAGAGVFGHDARVELINGEVVDMTPLGWRRIARHAKLTELFTLRLQGRAVVWPQGSIRLLPDSAPQPDLLLLRPPPEPYEQSGPRPDDVVLVLEIADTSLAFDRDDKMRLYAHAGLQEYWIVDLEGRTLDVYRAPAPTGYRDVKRLTSGAISLLALPDVSFAVSDIVG